MRAMSLNRLSARKVDTIKEPGRYADGGGLYLQVTKSGSKSWLFMYSRNGGNRREKGLGSLASVGLADARDKADALRRVIAAGKDPLEVREREDVLTFGEAANALLDGLESGWKNAKHRQQWRNTLNTYCAPLWSRDVAEVTTGEIVDILRPIWLEKRETAVRLRGRIERVLDSAKVSGHRTGDNPARWRGHLELIMPKGKKSKEHHPALDYAAAPEFVRGLKARFSMAARSLEFLIHTVPRTTEVRGFKWREVDMDAAVWTIPAERMKAGVEHIVPLTEPALVILRAQAVYGTDPDSFVFPGRSGGQLSNMAMDMLLRRMGCDDVTVHGFRSTFRDWVGEETDYERELAEWALAHAVGSEVERAYRRGTALTKRRELMDDWSAYVTGAPTSDRVHKKDV